MKITFKTKCDDGTKKTHTIDFPNTLTDKLWTERFFVNQTFAARTLATNWIIKFQARLRKHSNERADEFCFGVKYDRIPPPPKVVAKGLKWTPTQIKELEAQGILIQ